jgi:hypothetical protein
MNKKDNRIVVDISKCQYARFFYRNQYGDTVNILPNKPTVNAMLFDPDGIRFSSSLNEPKESMMSYAYRRNLLDIWIPELRLQVQANHSLIYTGDKAVSLWKEWNKRIFKKK